MEHHQITKLKERSAKNHAEKEAHRKAKELEHEREVLIQESPKSVKKEFWCPRCNSDMLLVAQKCVESDWTNKSQRIAYYATECPCGAILQRRITDKHSDPYFTLSESLKRQRIEHHKDILQPHESGYKMLYNK